MAALLGRVAEQRIGEGWACRTYLRYDEPIADVGGDETIERH